MFDLDSLAFLQTPPAIEALALLKNQNLDAANTLSLVTTLREQYTQQQTYALLTTAQLREKAVGKFGEDSRHMFFTDDALQQASDPLIRQYRRDSVQPGQRVLDLCCGIGADSLAFATSGADVTGVDLDPVRVKMAEMNAEALALCDVRFHRGDVTLPDFQCASSTVLQCPYDWVFFDPARRDANGRRIYDVNRYLPPLDVIHEFEGDAKLVKISPGVDLDQLENEPASVEFISVNGDLKEAVLHYPGRPGHSEATLLTGDVSSMHVLQWKPMDTVTKVSTGQPLGWLVEPDAALIRAGLVAEASIYAGGHLLDETIAYFTSDEQPKTPWFRSWQVIDWMPFNLKKLRAYLRERHVGHVTVKKRGSAITPDTLIPRLKLKGDQSVTLILTRHDGDQIVLICADYTLELR